jgi:hypothetical protein
MNELHLRQTLRALRVDRQPPHDLWPQIAPRLRRQPRRWQPAAWALAASLLLAAGSGLLLAPPRQPDQAAATAMLRHADAMTLQYRAALAELSVAPLPPELRGVAEQLDRDTERLREALHTQPHSLALLHQLRRTYDLRLRLSQRLLLG